MADAPLAVRSAHLSKSVQVAISGKGVEKAPVSKRKVSMAIMALPPVEDDPVGGMEDAYNNAQEGIDCASDYSLAVINATDEVAVTGMAESAPPPDSTPQETTVVEEVKSPNQVNLRHTKRHTRRRNVISKARRLTRKWRMRALSSSTTFTAKGRVPRPKTIVQHLRRATKLLIKRKSHACEYARREFNVLRNIIETRFHQVLCRCQARWDRFNAIYIQRLGEIMEGIVEEIELPSLEELAKQVPEPIRLQPVPNDDPRMSSLGILGCENKYFNDTPLANLNAHHQPQ
ncbi:hypothetical protein X943_002168 [Babesia divergens]|uniref:Uncharacterized protein n=1 Tax=Babesia divergens TaxID=32595 RepID=A0AAD9GHY9_BABDI|nr:hypothetical protein X943_002168 [Babesia divergens]